MRCHEGSPSTGQMMAREKKEALDKLEYLFYSLVEELRLLPRKEMSPILRSLVTSLSPSRTIPLLSCHVRAGARSSSSLPYSSAAGYSICATGTNYAATRPLRPNAQHIGCKVAGHAGKEQIQGQFCGFLLAIYGHSRFVTEAASQLRDKESFSNESRCLQGTVQNQC